MLERETDGAKAAAEVVAKRAYAAGDHDFAREVRAGCWDIDNRRDIHAVYERMMAGEEIGR